MDDSDLEAAQRAIDAAAEVRASLRRQKRSLEDEGRLVEQLWALDSAREPLRRHLLHAPKATAQFFAPEVRAVSAKISKERRRVERMLYGKPGREGWERGPRKKLLPVSHLSGTVRQAKGVPR